MYGDSDGSIDYSTEVGQARVLRTFESPKIDALLEKNIMFRLHITSGGLSFRG